MIIKAIRTSLRSCPIRGFRPSRSAVLPERSVGPASARDRLCRAAPVAAKGAVMRWAISAAQNLLDLRFRR